MSVQNRDGRSSSASSHSGSNIPTNRSSIRTPKRSRSQVSTSFEEKSADFLCPICFNLIEEAHITKCGHTFCYTCIVKSIESLKKCPKCGFTISSEDMIFPNFLLNELINKHKIRINGLQAFGLTRDSSGEFVASADGGLRDFVASESQNLTLPDVNVMLDILTQRKQLLEAESCAAQNKLLLEFLRHLLQQKKEQKSQIVREIAIIEHDIGEVENKLKEVHSKCPTLEDVERAAATASTSEGDAKVSAMKKEMIDLIDNIGSTMGNRDEASSSDTPSKRCGLSSMATRRRRMHAHFDDFVQCYFSSRSKDLFFGKEGNYFFM